MTAQGIEAATADKTRSGLAEGESPVRQDAPNPLYQEGYSMTDTTDQQVEESHRFFIRAARDFYDSGRDNFTPNYDNYGDLLASAEAIASLASVSSASAEPVAWCSPGQLANLMDVDVDGGVYLPIRKTERGNFTMPLYSASPEPVPATNQAGEVAKLRLLIENLAEAEKQRRALIEKNDVDFSPEANTAVGIARAAVEAATRELAGWSIANHPAILVALATQPATSQEGEGQLRAAAEFLSDRLDNLEWMDDDLEATLRDYMGHVDPAHARLRYALAATPTPPTLSEDLREATPTREAECFLCAGKCRGHGLADSGAWEPEAGSVAAEIRKALPIEPTEAMVLAAWDAAVPFGGLPTTKCVPAVWQAMLAALTPVKAS